jgi:hypothetical protein
VAWPNDPTWSARRDGETVHTDEGDRFTWVVQCGQLRLPSGRLVACDPFAMLEPGNNAFVSVPPGTYPVFVTLADVSDAQDRSHIREAYVTLAITEGTETRRKALALVREGATQPILADGEFAGFGVDSGTACFVDDRSVATCMPPAETWYEALFDNGRDDSWFSLMDDPEHIRAGLANIVLPLANDGENIVIVHSGWGDGAYPVVGSYDATGHLLAVHIDFGVIPWPEAAL